eukprot:354507-Chlamydomonas_euryale.AAC.3
MQYMHEGPRAFTLLWNRGGVVRAQNMRRGRRSRPITPAPWPPASGMHVLSLRPALASAGVIGRNSRPSEACFVQG